MTEKSSALELWLIRLGLAGIVLLAFLLNFHTLTDTDIFWHLKTGEIIWQTHQVPDRDLFSFTVAGKEWIDSQWLFQLIVYGLYRVSGYAGMVWFGAILSALTWALLLAAGFNRRKYFSLTLLVLISLLTASLRIRLRPEILTFFYLALELFLIRQYRLGKKAALYFLPGLLLLWVNSEGLWPIYFVVLGVFFLEECVYALGLPILARPARTGPIPAGKSARRLVPVLIVSLLLAFVNPFGWRGVIFPAHLLREVSADNFIKTIILDLQSPFSSLFSWFNRGPYLVLLAVSFIIAALMLSRRRLPLMPLLLYVLFLYLSLEATRNKALFALIAAGPLASAWAETDGGNSFLSIFAKRLERLRPAGLAALLLLMLLTAADLASSRFFLQNSSFSRFGTGALETDYPIRAADTLKRICAASGGRVSLKIFSDLTNAGYLIWAGWPDWKVYVDPRLELYGEEMLKKYYWASLRRGPFETEDRKYDFDAAVLTPASDSELIMSLGHDPGFCLVHLDGVSIVFMKNRPEFQAGIREYRLELSRGYSSPGPRGLGGLWRAREEFMVGSTISALGYPESAVPVLEQAAKLAPKNFSLNSNLGLALSYLKRYPEALPYLEAAARLKPGDIPNRNEQAWAYFATGRTEDAVEIYRQVLQRHPQEITTCMNLALVYEQSGSGLARGQWQSCRELANTDPQKFQAFLPEIEKALSRLER